MAKISILIKNFIRDRLLDSDTGFNYWLPIAVADPDYELPVDRNFNLQFGTNLFIGPVPPDALEQSSSISYPFCTLYTNKSKNTSIVTPSEFSGPVTSVIDWYLTAPTEQVNLLESVCDTIEDAMMETFNRKDYYGIWPTTTQYNNDLTCIRFPPVYSASLWRQTMRSIMTHNIIANGRFS